MNITFLGTGTSQGVPVISCPCAVCHSKNNKDKRLRTSVMVQQGDFTVVIDSGPDFRQQLLREQVQRLDAIIYTHSHNDHVAGLDDVRAFNFFTGKPVDIYCTAEVETAIRRQFYYAFDPDNNYPWTPRVTFHTITSAPFKAGPLDILPVEVLHHQLPVTGYRIGDFTYITDASFISVRELEKVYGTKILVLNALRKEKHFSHFSLQEAIAVAQKAGAEKTFLTHLSHQMGLHDAVSAELPPEIFIAYDGLKLGL